VASQGFPGFNAISHNGRQEDRQVETEVPGSPTETFLELTSDGYQGKNWFQNSQPEMRRITNADAHLDGQVISLQPEPIRTVGIAITFNANRRLVLWKSLSTGAEGTYQGSVGASGVAQDIYLEVGAGQVAHIVRYYDKNGFQYDFFGWDHSTGTPMPSHAEGQLWRVRDIAGGVGYCGNATNVISAATNGYDPVSKGMTSFTDSSGTEYVYTYSTAPIGGKVRLRQVQALRNTVVVETVSYFYYGDIILPHSTWNDDEIPNGAMHGLPGDLKFVTRTVPQSNPNVTIDYVRYFRYYVGEYDDIPPSLNLGRSHLIKMVIDVEGFRRADMQDNSVLDRSCIALSDAELLPYAASYLEYQKQVTTDNLAAFDGTKGTDYLVRRAVVGGSCGCAGSSSAGAYEYIHYERNLLHGSPCPGSSTPVSLPARRQPWLGGPDVTLPNQYPIDNWNHIVWFSRVVVKRPDGTFAVNYFDRGGNILGEVLIVLPESDHAIFAPNALPSSATTWATKYLRDSEGRIAAVCSPESIASYNHNVNGTCVEPMPVHGTEGLITYTEFLGEVSSELGFMGAVKRRGFSKGLSGDRYKTEEFSYLCEDPDNTVGIWDVFGEHAVVPIPHHVIADHLPTSIKRFTGTLWTDAGSPLEHTVYEYTFHDTGVPGSTWDNWRVSSRTRIVSAVPATQNGAGQEADDVTYYDVFGRVTATVDALGKRDEYVYDSLGRLSMRREDVGSGGHSLVTEYMYDAQDRLVNVVSPDDNTASTYFSKLSDGRQVVLQVPRVESGTFFGPADYSVQAQDGKTLASARLVFSGTTNGVAGTTSSAIGGWVSPLSADVLSAVQHGSVTDLQTFGFTPDGQKPIWNREYVAIPTSLPGTSGTHYDETTFEYDVPGRLSITTGPSGTKSKTEYDAAGRAFRRLISTGTNAFVLQSQTTFDGGNVGNGHVTQVIEYADTSDARVTEHKYDFRGRRIVTLPPVPPYSVTNYDDLGRVTASATYSSSANLNAEPTSTHPATNVVTQTANRLTLNQSFYDTRSRLWKQETTVTSGSGNQTMATLRWFDPRGRVIKEAGSSVSKTRYDRLGRPTNRFIIAKSGDTSYGDVFTTNNTLNLSGDVVLEESQSVYDAENGNVLMTVSISRRHDDTSTTGPLDTNADNNPLVVTASNVAGRAQITSYWYDVLDRETTTASYGTNSSIANIGTFDRATTNEPTISASNPDLLVSKATYGTDGRVLETTDPMGRKQRREYDAAGRTVATIDNFLGGSLADVNRDADVYTRYQYFNGLQTKLWVDLDGDSVMDADDQVTTYVYGTSTTDTPPSLINTGHLLREVIYPEQSSGQSVADRTVRYAYNRLGEQTKTRDQAGNEIETVYDALGREEARKVAHLAADFDGLVRRIGMVYDNRGRISTVTQYDSPSGGSIVDQVLYGYDGWNNIDYFVQDVDGAVGSFNSGTNRRSFAVDYDYELSTAGGEGGLTRRTEAGYYSRETLSTSDRFQRVQYSYGASNTTNQHANRVESVLVATGSASLAPVAKYDYLGWGQLVGTELFHVGGSARTALYNSSGAYTDMDRFNRPTKWDWNRVIDNAAAGTFYNYSILYDNNSNIVGTTDDVHKLANTSTHLFDMVYTNDGLNRLRGAHEGNAVGTGSSRAIDTTTRDRNEVWELLSQTGNWQRRKLDADGDGFFTGELDRNELSAFNEFSNANEWKQRRSEKQNSSNYDDFGYSYDKNGNLVYEALTKVRPGQANTFKQRAFVYDAFGRLRKVYNGPVGESQQIAEYRYNGLGFRTTWQYDADADGTLESSEQYHFMYDDRWRILATFRGFDENPKEAFVYHAAGFAGEGDSSYIDSVILRDADASTAWTSQASSTLNERRYFVQNWRADVVALLRGDGTPWEFIRYSAYGEATTHALADVNRDGIVNATDQADWEGLISEGASDAAVPFDLNFDGSGMGDPTDDELFSLSYSLSVSTSGVGQVGLRSGNRKGYAGYEFDPVLQAYHVRHRVYLPEIGRWNKKDPLGYVDGMSVYGYVASAPLRATDPTGQMSFVLMDVSPVTEPGTRPGTVPGRDANPRSRPPTEPKQRGLPSQRPPVTQPAPEDVPEELEKKKWWDWIWKIPVRAIGGAACVVFTPTKLGDSTIPLTHFDTQDTTRPDDDHYKRPYCSKELLGNGQCDFVCYCPDGYGSDAGGKVFKEKIYHLRGDCDRDVGWCSPM
jgi:RHS repeat-associated protein